MLSRAAALGVNVSEAARQGIAAALERATVTEQLDAICSEAAADPLALDAADVRSALQDIRAAGETR